MSAVVGVARPRRSHSFYAPRWLSYHISPIQPPTKGGGFKSGAADGAVRVIVLLWPGAAITVVEDGVSGVERPTRTVSVAIATSPPAPTRIESLLGRWPELPRYACFIVVTFSAQLSSWTP